MLTQAEANSLIAMQKSFVQNRPISIPPGSDQTHDLVGADPRERFLLDLWRGAIRLSKVKFQTRGRKVIVLVRLDVDGAPHTNPDGAKLGGTHLHLYREGYDAKWAFPLPPADFSDVGNLRRTFYDFCGYCRIVRPPPFQQGLV